MNKLENKLAIVTGGAMGNGLGITKVFLKYGCSVIIFDYSDKIKETLKELRSEFPNATISGYKVDIRDNSMVKACVDAVMEKCMDRNITDWGKIKNEIKDSLGEFVWRETKRRPMIMPIIMEV